MKQRRVQRPGSLPASRHAGRGAGWDGARSRSPNPPSAFDSSGPSCDHTRNLSKVPLVHAILKLFSQENTNVALPARTEGLFCGSWHAPVPAGGMNEEQSGKDNRGETAHLHRRRSLQPLSDVHPVEQWDTAACARFVS